MKTRYSLLLIAIFAITSSCKTQQTACERVSSPEQLPWLKQLIEKGTDYSGENKLVKINRVEYIIQNTGVKGTGFTIEYDYDELAPQNRFSAVYDCDGQSIVSYGGVVGCSGECSLMVLSYTTIYTAK